jgi:predicted RNase H-like nuclease (RuvC/YqgF family)
MDPAVGEMWRQSYRDCLKQLESAEIENNNLHKKIAELEDKVVKLEANQLYQTLCMQGNHGAAKVVWEMLKHL